VELRIYDLQGRLVHQRRESVQGGAALRLDLGAGRPPAAGVYFATVRDAGGRTTLPLKLVFLE
jgi:hypothetical protein